MGLVAVIMREPRLSMDEWLRHIEQNRALARRGPRTVKNPFTGKPALYTPRPSEVILVAGDKAVGAIEESSEFDEDVELHVFAPEPGMSDDGRRIVGEIVTALAASIIWCDVDPV